MITQLATSQANESLMKVVWTLLNRGLAVALNTWFCRIGSWCKPYQAIPSVTSVPADGYQSPRLGRLCCWRALDRKSCFRW